MPASAAPTGAADSPLRIRGLRFGWGAGPPALSDCNLCLPGPGLWMLVGSNGSGKSTLLRLIAGLLTPSAGTIERRGRAALVFQNPDHQLLLPSCSSDLLLSLAGLPEAEGLPRSERRHRLERCLAEVGLAGLLHRPIHTLSGGQKQRLAIAGALASDADLLLLDEPTALLDPGSQQEVLELIRQLCRPQPGQLSALWITHRLEELELCDGAARMEAGRIGPWQSGAALRRALSHA